MKHPLELVLNYSTPPESRDFCSCCIPILWNVRHWPAVQCTCDTRRTTIPFRTTSRRCDTWIGSPDEETMVKLWLWCVLQVWKRWGLWNISFIVCMHRLQFHLWNSRLAAGWVWPTGQRLGDSSQGRRIVPSPLGISGFITSLFPVCPTIWFPSRCIRTHGRRWTWTWVLLVGPRRFWQRNRLMLWMPWLDEGLLASDTSVNVARN